jgi:hypothetical protein
VNRHTPLTQRRRDFQPAKTFACDNYVLSRGGLLDRRLENCTGTARASPKSGQFGDQSSSPPSAEASTQPNDERSLGAGQIFVAGNHPIRLFVISKIELGSSRTEASDVGKHKNIGR